MNKRVEFNVFSSLVNHRIMYLLGYIPKDNRLYLGDKELNIVSYSLLLSVLDYQTAVMRKDFSIADNVLPTIPKDQRTRVARFLEKQVGPFGASSSVCLSSRLKLYGFSSFFWTGLQSAGASRVHRPRTQV